MPGFVLATALVVSNARAQGSPPTAPDASAPDAPAPAAPAAPAADHDSTESPPPADAWAGVIRRGIHDEGNQTRDEIESRLNGWEDAMPEPGSIDWVRQRVT